MPTEIISGLWIGDVNDSFDKNFLKDNHISIMINCTLNYGFPDLNLKKLRIPLSNNLTPGEDLVLLNKNKEKILDYIQENIELSNILVYCYDGILISPLIIAIFLIYKGNVSKDNIRSILKSKNQNISLDVDLSQFG